MYSEKRHALAGLQSDASVRLDLDRIRSAVFSIAPVFRNTPQYVCPPLGEALGCELILKLETANPIRCFKGRGAETVMTRLFNSGSRAAVCASAGNLGQALAYSGRSRQISTTVVAGSTANPYKLERIRALGATVCIVDGDIEDARHLARQIANSENAFLVEDSENIDTCEGAGTIGLELVEDAADDRVSIDGLAQVGDRRYADVVDEVISEVIAQPVYQEDANDRGTHHGPGVVDGSGK